jgi:predicted enzyme related to lactoylglutathione lyase
MSDTDDVKIGSIGWVDLTVENANDLKDFYQAVVGWEASEFDMGGYFDYVMGPPGSGSGVAGVCHARGTNEGLPAQWMIYITVGNLDESISQCTERGGRIIAGPRNMGEHGRYCVLKDPAGAVAALIEPV